MTPKNACQTAGRLAGSTGSTFESGAEAALGNSPAFTDVAFLARCWAIRAERDCEGPEDQTLPGRGRSSSSSEDADASGEATPSPGTPGEGWGEGAVFATGALLRFPDFEPSPLPSPGIPGEGEDARPLSIARAGSRFFFCAADAAGRAEDEERPAPPEPFPSMRPSNSPIDVN